MKKLLMAVTALSLISSVALADGHGDHKDKMKAALSQLPPEKAELVKATFKEMREERKAYKGEKEAHRAEMKALLTAPTFDKSAFIAKAKEKMSAHQTRKLKGVERMANLAEKLTQEERKILADIMPKKGKRGPKRD